VDSETTDLIRLAILLYLVLLPGTIALLMLISALGEALQRRRIRRILRRR
jgi:hypothetical protein